MTPGLSVIIHALKESRRIVQRMNSYAIYRIAETLRVLLFVTLAILIFNFFPVTAVMIVVLALLNDGSILSIAYDNVRQPRLRPSNQAGQRSLTQAATTAIRRDSRAQTHLGHVTSFSQSGLRPSTPAQPPPAPPGQGD
jgi:magnesium-transporting ATPase (P-type)